MIKKRKTIYYTIAIFIIVLLDLFLGYSYAEFSSSKVDINFVVREFYKSEGYNYKKIDYTKEYYSKEHGKILINNGKYNLVNENEEKIRDNITTTINYINNSTKNNIEFDFKNISPNDYYLLIESDDANYLHYYDVENNVLYLLDIPK